MLLVVELDAVGEGRIYRGLEDLFYTLDYVFAILTCVYDPAYVLLEYIVILFTFVEASLAVDCKDLFDYT